MYLSSNSSADGDSAVESSSDEGEGGDMMEGVGGEEEEGEGEEESGDSSDDDSGSDHDNFNPFGLNDGKSSATKLHTYILIFYTLHASIWPRSPVHVYSSGTCQ